MKAIKDQGEKQLKILASKTSKGVDFKNTSFKNRLDPESAKVYNNIKEQNKRIDYTKFVCIGSGKHHYNSTIFMSLGNFTENIYNDNLLLKMQKIDKGIWKM